MIAAIAVELLLLHAIKSGNYDALIFAVIAASVCFVPLLVMSLIMAFVPS